MSVTLLCILDGFGLNPSPEGNAVHSAKKPTFDRIFEKLPSTTLITHGERVGLPEGQMGNSEVGHLNIGAGRVVEQWLLRISRALKQGSLDESKRYKDLLRGAKGGAIHCIGLYSDGGVHSHKEHLNLLLDRLERDFAGDIYLHLFTDGRDTSPNEALRELKELESKVQKRARIKIASVAGRFFGMDRDKRWDRTKRAYDAVALALGPKCESASSWISKMYEQQITDEFIEPAVISPKTIEAEDGIVFWNFREDRIRQITAALTQVNFDGFSRPKPPQTGDKVLCFTEYDHSFGLPYLFEQIDIKNHLGEYLSTLGIKQLRVAETEKYPHVTYFFNGGVETPYPGEERKLIPSPRDVKTYDLKPEMSAYPVTEVVLEAIRSKSFGLIVVNLANCDMVGHTGVISAAVKAVETVDTCLGRMVEAINEVNGQALVIADHGNAEQMINYEDGTPQTAHTTFPVPAIMIGVAGNPKLRENGSLCDVAPTLLKMMNLKQPEEMTGQPLF